jgi:hypothetical protein
VAVVAQGGGIQLVCADQARVVFEGTDESTSEPAACVYSAVVAEDEDRRTLEARFDAARVAAIQAADEYVGLRARGVATKNTAEGRDQIREPTQEAMHYLEPPPGGSPAGAPPRRGSQPHDLAT